MTCPGSLLEMYMLTMCRYRIYDKPMSKSIPLRMKSEIKYPNHGKQAVMNYTTVIPCRNGFRTYYYSISRELSTKLFSNTETRSSKHYVTVDFT